MVLGLSLAMRLRQKVARSSPLVFAKRGLYTTSIFICIAFIHNGWFTMGDFDSLLKM